MKTSLTRHNRTRLVMIAAGIAFLGLAGASNAAQPNFFESQRMTVSYADLNIESAAGIKALYGRLQFAARRVCAPFDDGQHRTGDFHFRVCFRDALGSAVAKINKPTLTAMHSSAWPASGG
jgi:UrcA family protein